MTRPIGNFDSEGRLVRLHFQPTESCNLDDAEDKRELTWAEAFNLMWETGLRKEGPFIVADYLCSHCMGDEE